MHRRTFLLALGSVSAAAIFGHPVFAADSRILVAFFSATGTTKEIAKTIAQAVKGNLYEITPEKAYTKADLDWHDKKSRSSLEMADSQTRPKIAQALPDIRNYDVVFLGYPIWWGIAPRILQTFVEATDLTGKIVIPFCTSGGSPFDNSADLLIKGAPRAQWKNGRRFMPGVSPSEISSWVRQLGVVF
ncbi:MAG: NAD(P)H-dependent oxidoreductase [Desulfovibrionaceae bacterium]|nr:NAD(P)H-dependent oxidoreductase [Desulfovibrionaceae bacterium]